MSKKSVEGATIEPDLIVCPSFDTCGHQSLCICRMPYSVHVGWVQVWNPAFDVTPAQLITGIITEHGIIQQRDGAIDVNGFLRQHGLLEAEEPKQDGTSYLPNFIKSPGSGCPHRGLFLPRRRK